MPTFPEAGVPGFVLDAWYAAFVPVGTPPSIVARLNAELDKVLKDPAVREKVLKTATEPVGGAPERLARLVQEDSEKYARLVNELNIRMN